MPSQCLRGERKLITTTFRKLYAVEMYFLGENKGSQISPQHSCFYISDLNGSNESLRSWAKCFGKSSKIKCTWSFLNCFWNEQQYNPSAQKRNSREPVIVELHQPIGPDSFSFCSFPHPFMTRFSQWESSPSISELGHKLEVFLYESTCMMND